MNKIVTSKDAILCAGKEIVAEAGLQGLNIRDVAKRCGVSIGSIYNYFPTKSDLIIETIEAVWKEIMQDLTVSKDQYDFLESINSLFYDIQKGSQKFPNFLCSHSIRVDAMDKPKGRENMDIYFVHIRQVLGRILDSDERVRKNVFTDTFTEEEFIHFILNNLIALLSENATSCQILLEIISRILY